MLDKKLGKIERVKFGQTGGYDDSNLGLGLTLSGEGWGCTWSISHAFSQTIKWSEHCKWTEKDRDAGYAKTMREIDKLLIAAKVDTVDRLKGIPVEATFDGNLMKDFRILTEVL